MQQLLLQSECLFGVDQLLSQRLFSVNPSLPLRRYLHAWQQVDRRACHGEDDAMRTINYDDAYFCGCPCRNSCLRGT